MSIIRLTNSEMVIAEIKLCFTHCKSGTVGIFTHGPLGNASCYFKWTCYNLIKQTAYSNCTFSLTQLFYLQTFCVRKIWTKTILLLLCIVFSNLSKEDETFLWKQHLSFRPLGEQFPWQQLTDILGPVAFALNPFRHSQRRLCTTDWSTAFFPLPFSTSPHSIHHVLLAIWNVCSFTAFGRTMLFMLGK